MEASAKAAHRAFRRIATVVALGLGFALLFLGMAGDWAPVAAVGLGFFCISLLGPYLWHLLNRRIVFRKRGRLRVLRGNVKTIRAWRWSYDDSYKLYSFLELATPETLGPMTFYDADESTHTRLSLELDDPACTVAGNVTIYVMTVPWIRKAGELGQHTQHVFVIDLGDGASFERYPPSRRPPDEPGLAWGPAD